MTAREQGDRELDIVCLQHVPFEGPGEIATWAASRGHSLETVALFDPDHAHPQPADFLVIMGGPMSVHDDDAHPFLASERRMIGASVGSDTLVLGVCLGAQLLAAAMGAEVGKAPHAEIGWYPVTRTPDAGDCPVMGRMPRIVEALHWHGDMFQIPEGAVHAYTSEACPSQAFSYDDGRVVGVQFHLEQSGESLSELADAARSDLVDGPWIQPAEEMLASESFAASNEALFVLLDAMSTRRLAR